MNNSRNFYKWFYNNIHCHYYNILVKWCFLPFGGENKVRKMLLSNIDFKEDQKENYYQSKQKFLICVVVPAIQLL